MKKIKTILTLFLITILLLTGCTNNKTTQEGLISKILTQEFTTTIKNKKDIVQVAKTISKNNIIKTKVVVEEKTKDDFLTGFDEQITNFDKAVVIQPVISTIPFIAYIFETSDTKALTKELEKKKNPRFNICTEADDVAIKVVSNYVFFIMSPKTFEE